MSYTNQTTNYRFPQYIATDKMTILGDVNSMLSKLDDILKNIENNINAIGSDKIKEDIVNLKNQLTTVNSQLVAINSNINGFNIIKSEVETARKSYSSLTERINNEMYKGGNNLLHATSLRDECKPSDYWKIIGNGVSISDGWSPRGNKSFRFSVNNSSGIRSIAAQYSLHLSSRTTYTLQFNAVKDQNFTESDGNLKVEIKYPTANGEKTHTKTLTPSDFNSSFWLHFNFTFTTEGIQNNELVNINFLVGVGESWHGNVADFTLEDGVSNRQWFPNPQDIIDSAVSNSSKLISKPRFIKLKGESDFAFTGEHLLNFNNVVLKSNMDSSLIEEKGIYEIIVNNGVYFNATGQDSPTSTKLSGDVKVLVGDNIRGSDNFTITLEPNRGNCFKSIFHLQLNAGDLVKIKVFNTDYFNGTFDYRVENSYITIHKIS